jgi:hypothetical protein
MAPGRATDPTCARFSTAAMNASNSYSPRRRICRCRDGLGRDSGPTRAGKVPPKAEDRPRELHHCRADGVLVLIVGSEWGKQLSRRTQASQGWERGEDDQLTEAASVTVVPDRSWA